MIGIWNEPFASQNILVGLMALQHRGQESAGIAYLEEDNQIQSYRGPGLINDVFSEEIIENITPSRAAIGHVRYAQENIKDLNNIQPLVFKFTETDISLAHNGNLINGDSLKRDLEDEGAIFQSTSDSEILMHLIRRSKKETFHEKIKEAINTVKGGFSYILMTPDEMIAMVDPNGFQPLVVGQLPNGGYVVASESCALEHLRAEFLCDLTAGEILYVNDDGIKIEHYTEDYSQQIDAMEYIYFARPDSNLLGINVHNARKDSGVRLAKEHPCPEADIVVGVPNSSLSAASGFAEAAGLPNEMGLVKNQYIARTFIKPTQEERERGVQLKLSPVRKVVEGKKVVMIDDSIVRGTTSKRIVRLLKAAGATEVHVRIAAPPLTHPNYYGNDGTDRGSLIASNHSIEEIHELIEADSLGFISEEGLIESIGLELDEPNNGVFMGHFNGKYPTPLYDFEK